MFVFDGILKLLLSKPEIKTIVVSVQFVGTAAIAASSVAYQSSHIQATAASLEHGRLVAAKLTPPSQSPAKKIANKLNKNLFS